MRSLLALLVLLQAAPSIAASFYRTPGGSGAANVVDGIQRGSVAYARLTSADNDAVIGTAACESVKVALKCNIADAADTDCSLQVKQCPAGVTDGGNAQCSAVLSPLTGAFGADSIYGAQQQVTAVKDATIGAGQTAQLEVSCY